MIIFIVLLIITLVIHQFLVKKLDLSDMPTSKLTIRKVLFPIHYLIRDAIFLLVKNQVLTSVIWFFMAFIFLMFGVSSTLFGEDIRPVRLIYSVLGWVIWLVPPMADLNQGQLGKAYFATFANLKNAGLVNNNGIVLGKKSGSLISKNANTDGNVAIFGGAGTGKTASNLIPTLITFNGTGLVIDIKPELLEKTGHLHPNKKVLDFTNPTMSYDPLASVQSYTDVIDLAKTIIPISPDMREPYFKESAQNILASATWEFKDTKSFSEIAEWITANKSEDIIEYLSNSDKTETKILINSVDGIKHEQLSSLMNELRNALVLFATDPTLRALSGHGNQITPQDIENNWIYIVIPESKLLVYKNYLSLIVSQFTRYLTQRPENSTNNVLLALDEFPRLGYMPAFTEAIATLRSRKVSVMILLQSLAQLDSIYQETGRKIIMDNMHYTVVHNALDNTSQKYFSERAGAKTEVVKSRSYSSGGAGGTTDALFGGKSTNFNQQSVPLIRPEEFSTLEQPILFAYKLGVAKLNKSLWFNDPQMSDLIKNK